MIRSFHQKVTISTNRSIRDSSLIELRKVTISRKEPVQPDDEVHGVSAITILDIRVLSLTNLLENDRHKVIKFPRNGPNGIQSGPDMTSVVSGIGLHLRLLVSTQFRTFSTTSVVL
jgi:hypothetical protein